MRVSGRTFAIGDIHGDLAALEKLFSRLPALTADDTVVFLGDYIDRGPNSAGVVAWVRDFATRTPAKVICLRGNHEDAWLQVLDEGWPEFVMPRGNGCLECFRSFQGLAVPAEDEIPTYDEYEAMFDGRFFPADVVEWMKTLPFFYEDEHAIYVHAGLDGKHSEWKSPTDSRPAALLWTRNSDLWHTYQGKRLVFGHTPTMILPNDHLNWLQQIFDDDKDVWFRDNLIGIDTACGKGGFLSAVELPRRKVYESR